MLEKTQNTKQIYKGKIITVRVDQVLCSNGRVATREIVEHNPAVAILAYEEPNTYYFIRQYRHAIKKIILECPAGIIEPDEDPLEAAKRELKEETGLTANSWHDLGGAYLTPGFCDEYMHFYLATELEHGKQALEEDENIELIPMTGSEIETLIKKGELIDGKSILAYYLAKKVQKQ